MKKLILILAIVGSLFSCKKEGCTDYEATNFDDKAEKENGECLYAINEAVGNYSGSCQCDSMNPSETSFTVSKMNTDNKSVKVLFTKVPYGTYGFKDTVLSGTFEKTYYLKSELHFDNADGFYSIIAKGYLSGSTFSLEYQYYHYKFGTVNILKNCTITATKQ